MALVVFRNRFTHQLELSQDQEPRLKAGIDCEVVDNIEYE